MMTPDEIARLRTLCDAATPGPWHADTRERGDAVVWGPGDDQFLGNIGATVGPVAIDAHPDPSLATESHSKAQQILFDVERANAEFVAASRTALPALLDALDVAQAREAALRDEAVLWKGLHDDHCATGCAFSGQPVADPSPRVTVLLAAVEAVRSGSVAAIDVARDVLLALDAAQSPARPDGGSLTAVVPPAATSAAGEPDSLTRAAIEVAEAVLVWYVVEEEPWDAVSDALARYEAAKVGRDGKQSL